MFKIIIIYSETIFFVVLLLEIGCTISNNRQLQIKRFDNFYI